MKESESARGPTDAAETFNVSLEDRSSLDNVSTCKKKRFPFYDQKVHKSACATSKFRLTLQYIWINVNRNAVTIINT